MFVLLREKWGHLSYRYTFGKIKMMFQTTGMDEVNQRFYKVSEPSSKKERKAAMWQRKSCR